MFIHTNPYNSTSSMQKWFFVKSEQKRAEIQRLLDLALQSSSCDTDPYKGKLFIYMKAQSGISLLASECGNDLIFGLSLSTIFGI
jgi:gamma-tubulin complex component 6